MNYGARKILWSTHFAVLGLGVVLGLRGSLDSKLPGSYPSGVVAISPSSPFSTPVSELGDGVDPNATVPISTSEYAAAWDSLKGRFLPRQERLLIEKTLLEEWSVIDLAAAVRAVFGESTGQGPNGFGKFDIFTLLECCAPGIRADPLKAWELVRSNTFGLETGRFRKAWLDCMTEANPVLVFSILGELPKHERLSSLSVLAESSCSSYEPATRAAIWAKLSAMPDTPAEQESLTRVGEAMCRSISPAELAERLLGEPTPAARRICISALALSLFEVMEKEDFPKPLLDLPVAMRGEVAAASLKYGARHGNRALVLANIALDSGNLDALQAAAADLAYLRFAKGMDQELALAEWALRLPEDPRTLEIYRQSIEGAAYGALGTVREKLQSLPSGWQRDEGLAVIAKVEEQRRAEDE